MKGDQSKKHGKKRIRYRDPANIPDVASLSEWKQAYYALPTTKRTNNWLPETIHNSEAAAKKCVNGSATVAYQWKKNVARCGHRRSTGCGMEKKIFKVVVDGHDKWVVTTKKQYHCVDKKEGTFVFSILCIVSYSLIFS